MEKINHAPITEKIMKIDRNVKLIVRLVVMCSATESVNASWVVRNGLTAFWYRNDGNPINPVEDKPIPEEIIAMRNNIQFLILEELELNFLIISEPITNTVGIKIMKPR